MWGVTTSHDGPQSPQQPQVPPARQQPQIPQQWAPPPGWGFQPPAPQPRNGLGIAALILGICGVVSGIIPFFFWAALICGVIGLILGLVGWGRTRKGTATNTKTALFGTLVSAGAVAMGIWGAVILFQATDQFVKDMNNLGVPGANSAPASPSAAAPAAVDSAAEDAPTPAAVPGNHAGDVVGKRGDTLTLGTMSVKAEKLRQVSSQYGPAVKCSKVTYTNTGTSQESFNSYDWKLQNPSGAATSSTYISSDTLLSSGQLAPGGTTSGDVCFDTTAPMKGWVLLYAPGFSYDAGRAAFLD
jgi:hypothetical protein